MQSKYKHSLNKIVEKNKLLIILCLCFYSAISYSIDLGEILENSGFEGDTEQGERIDTNSVDQQNALKQMAEGSESKEMVFSLNEENETPEFLEIKMPVPATAKSANGELDFVGVAKQFLSSNKKVFKLVEPNEELNVITVSLDGHNNRHVKFQQTHHGLPVWGKEALVHMDDQASVYYFNGRYRPSISSQKGLDQQPSISEQEAENKIKNELGESELQVLNKEVMVYAEGEPRLVYQFDVMVGIDQHWLYFIDAHTAEVVHRINQIHTNYEMVQAEGKDVGGKSRSFKAIKEKDNYYMMDLTMPKPMKGRKEVFMGLLAEKDVGMEALEYTAVSKAIRVPLTVVYDAKEKKTHRNIPVVTNNHPSKNWDKAGVSAMYNALKTQKYFWDTFKRNGIDGKGMPAKSIIHADKKLNNASWNGMAIIYGDGDGKPFSTLTQCLDVGAHEMSHGIISNTAKLIYEKQSGALNESFADVFAIMVDRDDWLLGEDCTVAKPGFLRNLEDPNKGLSSQPKIMSNYKNWPLKKDRGGVHINSGIPNYAAYLTIDAIGRDKTEQIYYHALSYYLLKNSQFIDARRALIQSASDIYGKGKEVKAIETAWNKVEVIEPKKTKPQALKQENNNNNDVKDFESQLQDILKL